MLLGKKLSAKIIVGGKNFFEKKNCQKKKKKNCQ